MKNAFAHGVGASEVCFPLNLVLLIVTLGLILNHGNLGVHEAVCGSTYLFFLNVPSLLETESLAQDASYWCFSQRLTFLFT